MYTSNMKVLCVGSDFGTVGTRMAILVTNHFGASGCSIDQAAPMLKEEAFDLILLPANIKPGRCGQILTKAADAQIAFLEDSAYPHELIEIVERAECQLRLRKITHASSV